MSMGRMILLLHELADGSSHYDWMLQRFTRGQPFAPVLDPDERALITYRVMDRIDLEKTDFFPADRLEDHRNMYLDYAGPLSGGRGTVRKVARGLVRHIEEMPGAISIRGKFVGQKEYKWAGILKDGLWEFQRSQPIQTGPAYKPDPTEGDAGDWTHHSSGSGNVWRNFLLGGDE